MDTDWLFRSAVGVRIRDLESKMLGPQAQLLHLCGHLSLHHRDGPSLLWRHDIALLLAAHSDDLDWPDLVQRATALELLTAVRRVVPSVVRDFGLVLGPDVLAALADADVTHAEQVAFQRSDTSTPVSRIAADLAGLRGLGAWLRYLRGRAFPSRAFMMERYRVEDSRRLALAYPRRWAAAVRAMLRASPRSR